MKKNNLGTILHLALLLLGVTSIWAQQTPTNTSSSTVSKYDYYDAFAPFFTQIMEQVPVLQVANQVLNIGKTVPIIN